MHLSPPPLTADRTLTRQTAEDSGVVSADSSDEPVDTADDDTDRDERARPDRDQRPAPVPVPRQV